MTTITKFLSLAIVALVVGLTALSQAPAAYAEDLRLGKVLKNPSVSRSCGSSSTIKATLNFLNEQGEAPDQCEVFRYIAHSAAQCRCVREVLEGGGKDPAAYMDELEMTDYAISCDRSLSVEETQPEFCASGCDCDDTISSKSYR